ncbi:glutamine amidotransferase [Aurantimonas sp. 22II-16-19i]|nr:glutamine amidotransferase [Aurantimonas sp. 22II-16-19i]
MCRLLAYAGPPIFLDALLVEPRSSLIAQSMAARRAMTPVNGDGSGIGWYAERPEPGLYRSIVPAWSDANLVSLCRQIRSPLFMAHVRAATSGEVSMANCHPFTDGRSLFTHNGQIGDYTRLRRRIDALIPDELYHLRRGSTDSEAIFLAACRAGLGKDPARDLAKDSAKDWAGGLTEGSDGRGDRGLHEGRAGSPASTAEAMAATLAEIIAIRDAATDTTRAGMTGAGGRAATGETGRETGPTETGRGTGASGANGSFPQAFGPTVAHAGESTGRPGDGGPDGAAAPGFCPGGDTGAIRFAAIHADGERLTAYRWADDGRPPSLFWRRIGGAMGMGTVIASEPSDDTEEDWNLVPPSSMLTAWPDGRMTLAPFDPKPAVRFDARPAARGIC